MNEINLAAMFAAYLPGHPIVINTAYKNIGKLVGVSEPTAIVNPIEGFDPRVVQLSVLKIELTPLSKISDEDAIYCAGVVFGQTYMNWTTTVTNTETQVHSRYVDDEDEKTILFIPKSTEIYYTQEGKINEIDGCRMQEIIDYLRSKGYDCGYMHIPSLIDAGYAIDKTSL